MTDTPISGWLAASVEQRRQLYRVTKRIVDAGFVTWRDIYRDALDRPGGFGKGYEDNFRAGRISRKNASRIVRYLIERLTRPDAPIPLEFAPELLRADDVEDWDQLVDAASRDGIFFDVASDGQFQTAKRLHPDDTTSMWLQAPHHGKLIGLCRNGGGAWLALPLKFSPARYPEGRPIFVWIGEVFEHENKQTWRPNEDKGLKRLGPVTLVVIHLAESAPDYTARWTGLSPVSSVQLDRLAIHLRLTQPEFLSWRADLDIIPKPKIDETGS